MAAGSADPGAQCSDEQHMAPGAWNVKQGLFPGWLIGGKHPAKTAGCPELSLAAGKAGVEVRRGLSA